MSNQSNKRDTDRQGDTPEDDADLKNGTPIPTGHEADTGDGEEEAEADNGSPNTGDRRPAGT